MKDDVFKIMALSSVNLSLSSLSSWVRDIEPILRNATSLAQLAVAIITVVFIFKKIKQLDKKK